MPILPSCCRNCTACTVNTVFFSSEMPIASPTQSLADLANAFSVWNDRAILTPIPIASWGARERTLAGQFVVLPATTEALQALIEFFGGAESTADHDSVSHSPTSLEAQIPASELVGFLRRDLDPGVFLWVCACAVYPELHWDLTLHFASLPCMPTNLVTEANLLRLVGLPWFRVGFIPDELRWELIQQLKPDQERDVRRAIIGLLDTNPADEGSFASDTQLLQIAVSRYRVAKSRKERRASRELLQRATVSGSYGEYVALRSLESIQTSPLDFLLPRQLRRVFYRNGLSVLGLRTIVRLVLTLTIVTIGFSSWVLLGPASKSLDAEALQAAAGIPAVEVTGANVASLDSLQRLETIRQRLVVLNGYEHDGVPLSRRWSLDNIHEIYPNVRRLYFKGFHLLLFRQVQSTLLSTLRQLPPTPGPAYSPTYQTLNAYLITTSNHDKSTQLFLSPVLLDRWSAGRNIDPDRMQLAQKQFDFYSEELKAANPFSSENDTLAVERARAYLNRSGAQDSVYQYMLAEAERASHPVSFQQVFPAAAQAVVDLKIVPGGFTKPGWVFMQNAFKDPSRFFRAELWVMGEQGATGLDTADINQLRKRYQNDYIQQWREFIRNGAVLRYASLKDAIDKLRLLSGPQSPLLQLFSVVSKNTSVGVPDVDNMFRASQVLVPPPGDALAGAANQPYMSGLVGLQNAIDPFTSQPPNDAAIAQITPQQQLAKGKVGEMAVYFGNDSEAGTVRKLLEAPITNIDALLRASGAQAAAGRPVVAIGTVGADGNLVLPNITPGAHTVEIAGYKPLTKTFKAGETVQVGQSDLVPQLARVTARLVVTPANAAVTYSGADGKTHEARGPTVELDEGQYTFTATAPAHATESQTVRIAAGKPNTVTLSLAPTGSGVASMASPQTMEQWALTSGWKLENSWYVHRGGGLVLYPAVPSAGTFVFSARRGGGAVGGNRIQWAAGCIEDKSDYVLFGIDKKSFHRAAVTGGKQQKEKTEQLKSPAKEMEFTLRIEISASSVTTYMQGDSGWEKINSWTASGLNPANGKFGFYLPGSDEVYISNFSFIAQGGVNFLHGTLMVSSEPPGATIFLNDKPIRKTTPAQLSVPPGTYNVRVEKDGLRKSQSAEVRNGETKYIKIPLQ